MERREVGRIGPELRQVVLEASRALAFLDAQKLEELAATCHALQCDGWHRSELARQARAAAAEMAVFARILDATQANLQVLDRLRALREGRISYAEGEDPCWMREASHGND